MTFPNLIVLDAAIEKLLLFSKESICKLFGFFKLLASLRTPNIIFCLLIIFIDRLTDLRDFPKSADVIVCLSFGMELSYNSSQLFHMGFGQPTLLEHRDKQVILG